MCYEYFAKMSNIFYAIVFFRGGGEGGGGEGEGGGGGREEGEGGRRGRGRGEGKGKGEGKGRGGEGRGDKCFFMKSPCWWWGLVSCMHATQTVNLLSLLHKIF